MRFIGKFTAAFLCAVMSILVIGQMAASVVYADPQAAVADVNTWGDGGQISLNLSGCDGYGELTVVVSFTGSVSSASGWGFDSYSVSGNNVTAVVSAAGGNSWAFNGGVGIQVTGSGIDGASLVSITGSGTAAATTAAGTTQTTAASSAGTTAEVDTSASVEGDDWLTTDGDKIVDMNGTEVWLTGCNWFGYNTGSNIFDGVYTCNMREALTAIADHGFNLLRVPMSAELLLQWKNGEYPEANYNHASNSELEGMNSLEIFDYALDICQANGIKVMIDIHSANTDASGHMLPLWYTDSISTAQYLEALDWLSARYCDDDTIVAYDLKNEPHGKASEEFHAIWNDSEDDNNWKYIAEQAGNTVLDNNPHALIMIEGIQIYPTDISSNNFTSTNDEDYYNSWWGGNLRAVADYPIDFGSEERNAQIVYSPHDYGPSVYQQPWFEDGFTYESLMDDYWYDAWLYIDDQGIAPLLIGEWGGFMEGDNLTWMTYMRQLISEYHLNHTFWCFNANSGDTGGLVLDDFVTWDTEKYEFVKEVLWQTEDGQFIGLDHAVPLGTNGISLSDYSGETVTPVVSGNTDLSSSSSSSASSAAEGTEENTTGTDVSVSEESAGTQSGSVIKNVLIVLGAAVGVFAAVLIGRYVYVLGVGKKPGEAFKYIFKSLKNQ